MDFGSQYLRDEQGELLLKQTDEGIMENIWWTSDPLCDFDMHQIEINGKSIWVTDDTLVTPGNDSVVVTTPKTPEEMEWENARWARDIQSTPLKPEYGVTCGMFTEADPAEMDLGSWSGTAIKDQFPESSESSLERTFAFTPYLGEYAAITIENTGISDVQIEITRPDTVGSCSGKFGTVRVPAGQKLTRAFRINPDCLLRIS